MLLTRDNWILELAWNKRMYFPSLSEVTLREAVKDRTSPFAGLQLEIPEYVQKAFEETGISLRIRTRILTARMIASAT